MENGRPTAHTTSTGMQTPPPCMITRATVTTCPGGRVQLADGGAGGGGELSSEVGWGDRDISFLNGTGFGATNWELKR